MRTILPFLSIVFMRISSEDHFDCTGYEEDSFHPVSNGNDCRLYWHCVHVDTVHMQAVKRVCPSGTGFDFQSNQCQWMTAVSYSSISSLSTLLFRRIANPLFIRLHLKYYQRILRIFSLIK